MVSGTKPLVRSKPREPWSRQIDEYQRPAYLDPSKAAYRERTSGHDVDAGRLPERFDERAMFVAPEIQHAVVPLWSIESVVARAPKVQRFPVAAMTANPGTPRHMERKQTSGKVSRRLRMWPGTRRLGTGGGLTPHRAPHTCGLLAEPGRRPLAAASRAAFRRRGASLG